MNKIDIDPNKFDFIFNSKVDYSELYFENLTNFFLKIEGSKIENLSEGEISGCGIRILNNDETYFANCDSFLPDKILSVYKQITPEFSFKSSKFKEKIEFTHPSQINFLETDKKIKFFFDLDKYIRSQSELVKQVILSYAESEIEILILNSNLEYLGEKKSYITLGLTIICEEDKLLRRSGELISGIGGWEIIKNKDLFEIARKTLLLTLEKLKAPKAPVGELPVVIDSVAGGTLIHEAVGHCLEADSVQKGISPAYIDKLNKKVASDLITVIDDPTIPQNRGSFFIDDEGTKAKKTILIENGILKDYLYDRLTSKKQNTISNGHGRRQSYSNRPIPRMSNTYIAQGNTPPEKIISSINFGILVKKMGGGQVNPATGDFMFEVEDGYLIKDGKTQHMIYGASLLGNGPDVLNSIDMVGNDLGWASGSCGKEGQIVPVSDGLPTIRIPKLTVGGEAKINNID